MAIAWSEVERKPEFQQLPVEQKVAAQEQYFNDVVAPKVGDNAETAKQQFMTQYNYQDQPEEKGFGQKVSDFFTGEDRATDATRNLPELGQGGLLSGEDMAVGAKVAPLLALTTNPQEQADILKANYPSIGISYDEKGNIMAYNPKNQARVMINKPGASPMDFVNAIGLGALFTPAGKTGAGFGGAAKAAQVSAQSGLTSAALEGSQSALGGEFNVDTVIADAIAGGAVESLPALFKALKDRKASQAETLTAEAAELEAARISDSISPESQQLRRTEQVEELAQQAGKSKPDVRQIASDVNPDPTIVKSAERLGVEDVLTPGQVSGSQTYRELEGAISAVPASQLSAQQKEAATKVAQKADDLIVEYGGTTDKAALSEKLKSDILRNITDIDEEASAIYAQINNAIPNRHQVDASNVVTALKEEAEDLGGEANLEGIQKRILKLMESNPTYSLIDKERKKVGQALRASKGPYKDSDTGTLKRLYSSLTDAQEKTAVEFGMGESWGVAKTLVSQRKNLEEQSINLLGRDMAAAIIPKLGTAFKRLAVGDYKNFDNIIKSIPKENRQEAVMTALNDVFTAGSRKEKQLSPAGFADWYENLKRNSSAMARIKSNIPTEAADRLDDIYQVSRGLRQASAERVRTGVIQGLLDNFDEADGMLSKLYSTGKQVVAAEGVTTGAGVPGAGTVGVISSVLSKGAKDPVAKSADALLSSNQFKNAVKQYADVSVRAQAKQAAANKALIKSEAYNTWLERLPNKKKREIIRLGLINYLARDEDSKQQEQQR